MSNEPGNDAEKLLMRRAMIKDMQKKRDDSKVAYEEISNLKSELYALGEEISHVKDDLINLREEIEKNQETLQQVKKKHDEIFEDDSGNKRNAHLLAVKDKHVKRIFEEILEDKIPMKEHEKKTIHSDETNHIQETFGSVKQIIKKNVMKVNVVSNEFHDLMFDYISIKYCIYDTNNPLNILNEDFQNFRITKTTSFIELKKIACIFWCIDNDSDYIITENSESIIYDEEIIIDNYMKNYSVQTNTLKLISIPLLSLRNHLLSSQVLVLREGNKFLKNDDKNDDDFILFNNDANLKMIQSETRNFFTDYPNLKTYMLDEKGGRELILQAASHTEKKIENSFFMMLVLISLYVFTIIFIYMVRDISRSNRNRKYMNALLNPPDLYSFSDVKNYMINKIGRVLFKTDYSFFNESILYDHLQNYTQTLSPEQSEAVKNHLMQRNYVFQLVSSLHIIIDNVKSFNKTEPIKIDDTNKLNGTRYYPFYESTYSSNYSDNLNQIYLKTQLPGLKNFSKFQTSDQAKITLNIQGITGTYDGSGFHGDINGEMDFFKYKDFINTYIPYDDSTENKENYFLIDKSTRAMILIFTLYYPNSGNWMNIVINLEFLPTGIIYKNDALIRVFNPNIYSINPLLKIIDILRISIISILLIFLIIEIKEKLDNFKSNFFGTISSKMLITIYLVVAFTINMYFKLFYFSKDFTQYYLPKKDAYIDTFRMGYIYNQVFFIESLLFAGISVKILDFLKINEYIKLFFTSFDYGYTLFLKYLIIILIALMYFTSVSHILWGPYMYGYITFGKTLNNILLFTLGIYDTKILLYFNSKFIIYFFITLFIFMILLMSSIFIPLYIESLRKAVTRLGYPEDHEATSWGLKEIMIWFCYCVGGEDRKKDQRKKKR